MPDDNAKIVILIDAIAMLAAQLSRVEELIEKIALGMGIRIEKKPEQKK